MQRPGNYIPQLDSNQLKAVWHQALPNPQRQLDLMILLLGDANLPLGEFVSDTGERFCAEIGTADDSSQGKTTGFKIVVRRLVDEGMIEAVAQTSGSNVGYRLTIDGWALYETLKRKVPDSRTAFMAMAYGDALLDRIVADYFVPAVKATGFNLHRLNERPGAGLIDNRMRVAIRTARFLVCDLTHENRGAYWEAGFAEGLDRKVYYTCERAKFEEKKTHFDTEHMLTVLWSPGDAREAMEELKAAIRNDHPSDATMVDASPSESAS